MSVLVFEHSPAEGAAQLGAALQRYGRRLSRIRLYRGEPVPPGLGEVDGVISMGGPMNVDQADRYPWITDEMRYLKAAHEASVPVVGVCLGAQFIAAALGGKVAAMSRPEIGWEPVDLTFPGVTDPVYAGIAGRSVQFHIHGQEVAELPAGATPLASSSCCRNQAFSVGQTTYAFQYHFEWSRDDLAVVAGDPLIDEAGLNGQQIIQQGDAYYDDYRRLGDRLSGNLARCLFRGAQH